MRVFDRSPPRQRSRPYLARARPVVGLLTAIVVVLAITAPVEALSVLVSPGADLPAGLARIHPDTSLGLSGAYTFNVYTGASLPSEWVFMDSLTTPFSNVSVGGTFYSEVYRHSTEGHTLFRYKIANTGTTPIRSGNIAGFASGWEFLDSGILDLGGDLAFDQGDVLMLNRPANGAQLDFAFQGWTGSTWLEKLLAVGQTSSWFYAVTDAPSWTIGRATVQDTGSSASPVAVLVPVPEPVTVLGVFMGLAGLGGYIRRRLA